MKLQFSWRTEFQVDYLKLSFGNGNNLVVKVRWELSTDCLLSDCYYPEDALNVPLMKLVPFEKLIISKRTNQSPQKYNYSSTSKIEDWI